MTTTGVDSLAMGFVKPAYRHCPDYQLTFGPIVAELNAMAGFAPDKEQELGLDMLFAVGPDGKSAAFEFAIIAPRQNLKTGLLKQAALGWLYITDQRTVMWSAHLFDTAREAFRDLSNIIVNTPMLSKRLAPGVSNGIHGARGGENIELATGQRLMFKARSDSGGRGLSGDKVVLDEAFALTDGMLGALLPTLTSVPDPQVIYASSAGMETSTELRAIRDRGRVGGSTQLAYLEWSAPKRPCAHPSCTHAKPGSDAWKPGCQLDNRDNWHAANTLLGRVRANGSGFPVDQMEKFRQAMPPAEFAREYLGWWVEADSAQVFGPNWARCKVGPDVLPDPLPDPTALGLAVSVDLKWSAIVGAVRLPLLSPRRPGDEFVLSDVNSDQPPMVERERLVLKPLDYREGTDWLVERVKELADGIHGVQVIMDSGGPGGFLVEQLTKKLGRRRFKPANLSQYANACADLYTNVGDTVLAHGGWPELDDAVANATMRTVSDRWVWGRRGLVGDITVLEAGTMAGWGARAYRSAVSDSDGEDVLV